MSTQLSPNIVYDYGYNRLHGYTDKDNEKADLLKSLIENRNKTCPQTGDIVICKNPEGTVTYEGGHLERVPKPGVFSNICTEPYVPFVYVSKESGKICTSSSGGVWVTEEDPAILKRLGERIKNFKEWGHCGPCENGAFTFMAEVSVWLYVSDSIY